PTSFGAGIPYTTLFPSNSPTSATATLTIDPAATVGNRNVTLTTNAEIVTATNGFSVTAGAPAITQVNPSTGQQGQQNLAVTITEQGTHHVRSPTTAIFG